MVSKLDFLEHSSKNLQIQPNLNLEKFGCSAFCTSLADLTIGGTFYVELCCNYRTIKIYKIQNL